MKALLPFSLLVNIVFSIVEFFLGIRILLRLFGANPNTPFVSWVYDTTAPLLSPFSGIFPNPTITPGFVLEMSSLFALLVYGFIAYLIALLIDFVNDKMVVERVERAEKRR
ncbi:MAG: YggT family protein [Candidatus Levybacteria bacterium]|nr:YggT family protein [Candidatus Levybacteria bacterium]